MENTEFEKSKVLTMNTMLDYLPSAVSMKTILRKVTGNISGVSFQEGQCWAEKISPFDTFVQIIDGKAEIIINGESFEVNSGQSIIIPAHSRNTVKANVKFRMLTTIIKSGYEELV